MKKTVAAVAALLLVTAALASSFWFQLRTERQRGGDLVARVEALEAAAPAAPSSVATPPSQAPAAAPSPTPSPSTPSPSTPPPVAQAPRAGTGNGQAAIAAVLQSPQALEGMRSMMRGMMDQMYPDAAAELGLTPAEKERLFDLIGRHQDDITAESLALVTGGGRDPVAARELQRKLADKEAAHERELAAMLGGKYPKWQEYQGTAAARQQVGALRTQLAAAGNPLGEAQEKSLVAAFATELARTQKEEREWMSSSADSPDMMQESLQRALQGQSRLIDVAAPHLDAAQQAHFRRQVEQQQKMMQSMMGMFGGQGTRP